MLELVRRVVVSLALVAVRVVGGMMFASAIALVLATAVSSLLADGDRGQWVEAISAGSLRIALIFGAASAGAFLVMPARRDMTRMVPPDAGRSILVAGFFIGLLVAAMLQAPWLSTWGAETRTALDELVGNDPDPLGLYAIPTVLAFLLPGLAMAAMVLCASTSILALAVRTDVARKALAACVLLQGGLILSSILLRSDIHRLGTLVLEFVGSAGSPSAWGAEWLARHDLRAATTNVRLLWLLGGSLVGLALFETMAAARKPALSSSAPPR